LDNKLLAALTLEAVSVLALVMDEFLTALIVLPAETVKPVALVAAGVALDDSTVDVIAAAGEPVVVAVALEPVAPVVEIVLLVIPD
jgi:hypothetical protein